MKNTLVSGIFRALAELLEIKGDNPFRIRAYLRAAEAVETLKEDIEILADENRLEEIAGIGRDLAAKAKEIIATGKCRQYTELKQLIPEGVLEMLQVPSVGPKTAKLLYERLKISSVEELKEAAQAGRLLSLPGLKQKTVDNILKGVQLLKKGKERMDLLTATTIAEDIISSLKKQKEVEKIALAGSLRRMKENVRDIDILAASKNPPATIRTFISLPRVKRVLAQGPTKSSILTREDAQVDLRVIESRSFGAGLLYFTGSKNHNVKLRQLAIKQGLKINEYGLYDKDNSCLASETEEDIYRLIGLDYMAPELREDSGEIEAAFEHRLPRLLELKDIRGDFHAHTHYSDGKDSIEEMGRAARALGYDYLCLTDHSVSLKVAHGLDKQRLKEKRREIDRFNSVFKNFRILFGSEVEIDAQGDIDYPRQILAGFDIVVAAIHSGFKQSKAQLTQRLIKACRNKYVHILAHPTGRLWPTRESYELDFKEIFQAAVETNTALEINGHPYRLDLGDVHARWAKENGARLVVSTDAHHAQELSYMRFGVGCARRAWLEKRDVLNSLSLKELFEAIRK